MIESYKFQVVGLTPILMGNPASMKETKGQLSVKEKPTPEQQCESLVYRNGDKQLHVPSAWFRSSLLKGCLNRKLGTKSARTPVQATATPTHEWCLLFDQTDRSAITEYEVFTTTAVNRMGAKELRIFISRPRVGNWMTELELELDSDFVQVDHILELFNIAGRIAGVGCWRPNRGGTFGRYAVSLD